MALWFTMRKCQQHLVPSRPIRYRGRRAGACTARPKTWNGSSGAAGASRASGGGACIVRSQIGRIDGNACVAGAAFGWHCVFGIVGLAFLVSWQGNTHMGGLRAVRARKESGYAADGCEHMGVAHLCRYGSLGKVFRVDSVTTRVVGADTRNGQLAGFAADLYPSWTRVMILRQISLWKEVPPFCAVSFWFSSQPPHTPAV